MQIAGVTGLSQMNQNFYEEFLLRGKQLKENKEIESIKKILGLQHDKQYNNVNPLRYNHMMMMTDQISA